jgi:hypothetical protein
VPGFGSQVVYGTLLLGTSPPVRDGIAVFYPDGEGGFTVVVPALPGCVTEGDSREEALANVREAIEGYLLCTPGAFEMEADGVEEEIEL